MTQLTGLYVSDPNLTTTSTLGELYHHFCVAAKPDLAKVYKYIQVEGSKENHKANDLAGIWTKQQKARPTVGELLKLGNVQVHSKKPTAKEERKKTGLHKAIRRELKQRDLLDRRPQGRDERLQQINERMLRSRETNMIEGTRVAPQFGTVVAREAAHLLKERTERKRKELLDSRSFDAVDQLVRERNLAPATERSVL
jgi:hypothetical protein